MPSAWQLTLAGCELANLDSAGRLTVRVTGALFLTALAAEAARWLTGGHVAPVVWGGRELAGAALLASGAFALAAPDQARRWLLLLALLSVASPLVAERTSADLLCLVCSLGAVILAATLPPAGVGAVRRWLPVVAALPLVGAVGAAFWTVVRHDDFLAEYQLWWQGAIAGDRISEARGSEIPFALTLPPGTWFKLTPAAAARDDDLLNQLESGIQAEEPRAAKKSEQENASTTRRAMHALIQARLKASETIALVEPRRHTRLSITAAYIPAAGEIGLETIVNELKTGASHVGLKVETRPIDPAAFEDAQLVSLTRHVQDSDLQGDRALFIRGDRIIEIRTASSGAVDAALRSAISAVTLEHRAAPVLEPTIAAYAKESAVLVLKAEGSGSGFVVGKHGDELGIVTNAHVVNMQVDPRTAAFSGGLSVVFPSSADDGGHSARIIAVDADADLALIAVKDFAHAPPAMPMRLTLPLDPGVPAFVVGFPLGMSLGSYGLYPTPTINGGRLLPRPVLPPELREAIIPVDVGVNPGNSGGPMVDAGGEVIGVAVAHVPGSDLSFVIPTEAVRKFLEARAAGWSGSLVAASLRPEAATQPVMAPEKKLRAQGAFVAVSTRSATGPGVLVEGPGDQLLVATQHELVHDDDGHRLADINVTLFPGTDHKKTVPARVVRSIEVDNVAILGVDRFKGAPDPMPLGDASSLQDTAPLDLLSFRLTSHNELSLSNARMLWRPASLSGLSYGDLRELVSLRVDAGVNHGFSGGPVLDRSGALVGLAVTTEQGSNVTVAVPSSIIRRAMDGGITGGTIQHVFDGLGGCFLQFVLQIDDPLRTLKSVGLALAAAEGERGNAPEREGGFRYGDPVAQLQPSGLTSVVMTTRPKSCSFGWVGYQLWVESATSRRLEPQHWVQLVQTGPRPSVDTIPAGPLAGDVPRASSSEQATPFVPPADWGTVCDPKDAQGCFNRCRQGDVKRCYAVASIIRDSQPDLATKLLLEVCDHRILEGCQMASEIFQHAGDWKQTVRVLERACNGGHAYSCARLGGVLRHPHDAPPDLVAARAAVSRGCALNDSVACDNLGVMLTDGSGGPVDPPRAHESFTRACELADPNGCRNLAIDYDAGHVVPEDSRHAARLLAKSCEMQNGSACKDLGDLHLKGRGTTRSMLEALYSYRQACDLNNAAGCSALKRLLRGLLGNVIVLDDDPWQGLDVPGLPGAGMNPFIPSGSFAPPMPGMPGFDPFGRPF